MKIPKDILSNNEKVPHFEKISTQILLKNQKDRVIIIQDFRVGESTQDCFTMCYT